MSADALEEELAAIGDGPLLVALDFDGTLAPIVAHPPDARPIPGVMDCLEALAASPETWVALVSGRGYSDLLELSGAGEAIRLLGSHGVEAGSSGHLLGGVERAQLHEVSGEAERIAGEVPGVLVEAKPASVTVHYREALDQVRGAAAAQDFAEWASERGLHVLTGKMVVEVGVRPLDKGAALAAVREELGWPSMVFAGDDVTDESVMQRAQEGDVTIRVGPGDSAARYRVADPAELAALLHLLQRIRSRQR